MAQLEQDDLAIYYKNNIDVTTKNINVTDTYDIDGIERK